MPATLSRQELIALLHEKGLTPNKALGQNFLSDQSAVLAIVDAAEIDGKPVLEIGPGLGALTGSLLARASRVAAVEIDRRMAEILSERYGGELLLYREDFLKSDLASIRDALGGKSFCVAGNLPYYITTPICMKLLENASYVESMTLMVQEEAAGRFFAKPGDRVYGPLAVLSQAFFDAESVMRLSPESYYPQPDVYSRVIRLARNEQPFLPGLPLLLRDAFRMRRKTLINNLKASYPDTPAVQSSLRECALSLDVRAEALSASDYIKLYQALL